MKIGIIVSAYSCPFVSECLKPWVELMREGNEDIAELGIVSTRFKDFPQRDNRTTISDISTAVSSVKSLIITAPEPVSEAEARNMPLHYFLEYGFDAVWILDSDELYTKEEILKTIKFVKANPLVMWFSMPFKNFIFDGNHWIDGFCPPRIFRTKTDDQKLGQFFWDNDVEYIHAASGETHSYKAFASLSVPKSIAHIRHMTWLHTNSKEKCLYQGKHFEPPPHCSESCSYRWDDSKEQVEFNDKFFMERGLELPEVFEEEVDN